MSDVVCLRRYIDPEEALVVRGALCAAGVHVILFNEQFLISLPHMRVAAGGFRLSVPASEEGAAREALVEIESYKSDEPIGADEPCANCGGRDFRRERSLRWAIVALFLETGLAAQARRSRCLRCGETVSNDDRPITVRIFFFLASIAMILLIGWLWLPLLAFYNSY